MRKARQLANRNPDAWQLDGASLVRVVATAK
jgi:hypothetical protein